MKSYIKHEFEGYINNVLFNDAQNYYATEYILTTIEAKFDEIYTDEFVSDLSDAITHCAYKTFEFSMSDFEEEMIENIFGAKSFEDIQFSPVYFNQELNQNLKQGKYTKKKEVK